ncbi:MAG: TIR domain-containing protein [Verrucomicrobia bacterium]|nr:TIR domain-containing protein [Verrucomicrobiota bacterium]
MTTVFLSHKSQHASAARALAGALSIVFGRAEVFLAEDIEKGEDWRAEIDLALREAKCFILLYGDPQLDWSWCFYEAGAFAKMKDKPGRPVFCLHPADVAPPSPLAYLQTITATADQLEQWIRNALCSIHGCQQPTADEISSSIEKIEKLVNNTGPVQEKVLKPFIWIEPSWPGPGDEPNWNDERALSEIDFSRASVLIDPDSATQLGFATPPRRKQLLPFLRELACDAEWSDDRVEFWIAKLFESLREAAKGRLLFQEAAYFRHESGRILRPVVVSYVKNSSGTKCRLRVIFASAFGSPLTDNPNLVQRLTVGIRLAVRTRLEVLDPFLGRMAEVHRDKVLSAHPRDAIARRNPVGGRVTEALDAILQEALAHGMRPGDPPPRLFEGPAQHEYEEIRNRAVSLWQGLKNKTWQEDQKGTGEYPESELLLGELDQCNQAYLDLSLPRLQELLRRGH